MSKILVLGGTGWLGRTLCEQALVSGHEVHALARGSHEFAVGAEPIIADRTHPDAYALASALRWDLIVELTSEPQQAREALGALATTATHWVNVSSCSVYAEQSVPGADEDAGVLDPLPPEAPAADYDYGRAKSYGERITMNSTGARALVVRPGLIGGPGDTSGRSTYWPLRFSESRSPVLVPEDRGNEHSVQVIDVRDLAAFILDAGLAGHHGYVNAVGEQTTLTQALQLAKAAGGLAQNHQVVPYNLARLEEDGVNPWAGSKSLPLVLPPGEEYAGFARRADSRSLQMGLERRGLDRTFADIVQAGSAGGAGTLKSGLSPVEEAGLIAACAGGATPWIATAQLTAVDENGQDGKVPLST